MPSLDMDGPYKLSTDKIDQVVSRTSPGNYALGRVSNSTFYVRYIGRSDSDVKSRLKRWVGVSKTYQQFKFSYATSPKAAFQKECKNYHDFGGTESLDNEEHPERPKVRDWKCSFCDIFA